MKPSPAAENHSLPERNDWRKPLNLTMQPRHSPFFLTLYSWDKDQYFFVELAAWKRIISGHYKDEFPGLHTKAAPGAIALWWLLNSNDQISQLKFKNTFPVCWERTMTIQLSAFPFRWAEILNTQHISARQHRETETHGNIWCAPKIHHPVCQGKPVAEIGKKLGGSCPQFCSELLLRKNLFSIAHCQVGFGFSDINGKSSHQGIHKGLRFSPLR